jgi:hypothetical protein
MHQMRGGLLQHCYGGETEQCKLKPPVARIVQFDSRRRKEDELRGK